MSSQNYRHVCFKDLENYFKKDEYFGDLSDEEKKLIIQNLGISSYSTVILPYQELKSIVDDNDLQIGGIYIVNDFQSIYKYDNHVLGYDGSIFPSKKYSVVLQATSGNTFSKNVTLVSKDNDKISTSWVVEYDFTQEILDGIKTKGKITFLKDNNNNYAYYDFKNVRFKRTQGELNKGASSYNNDQYFYTFNYNGTEASESESCKNNHLEKGCINNVFLSPDCQNNILKSDCHNNTFFKMCENNEFSYGTRNNYFVEPVRSVKGFVHDKTLSEEISMSTPKELNVINDQQVMIYIDPETKTYQIKEL